MVVSTELKVDAFFIVSVLRIVISITGWAIMFAYKTRAGLIGFYDQAKIGVPIKMGLYTLWEMGKFVYDQPNRGAWVVGHVLCMFSSFVGSCYMFIVIALDRFDFADGGDPQWIQFCAGFRTIGVVIAIPLCLLQVLLVAIGLYGYHRWCGRLLAHIWTWTSIAIVLLSNSYSAFVISMVLLSIETTIFFAWKWHAEIYSAIDVAIQHHHQAHLHDHDHDQVYDADLVLVSNAMPKSNKVHPIQN